MRAEPVTEGRDLTRPAAAAQVARVEGVRLERIGKVHPRISPYLLRLPNPLFLRIAGAMLAIDPAARSSMAEDYQKGRGSEVDHLNGYVASRAKAHGLPAPVNERVAARVRAAFAGPERVKLSVDPSEMLG